MKKMTVLLLMIASQAAISDTFVNGYTRSDGTYVAPHTRSSPDAYRYNNYGSQSNGGYQRDEYSSPPAYNRSNPSYGSGFGYQDNSGSYQDQYGGYSNR